MTLNIDHIVLTINDMEKTISFYRDVLGMTVKEFQPVGGGETRKSLSFGNQKINLHHVKSPYINLMQRTLYLELLTFVFLVQHHFRNGNQSF